MQTKIFRALLIAFFGALSTFLVIFAYSYLQKFGVLSNLDGVEVNARRDFLIILPGAIFFGPVISTLGYELFLKRIPDFWRKLRLYVLVLFMGSTLGGSMTFFVQSPFASIFWAPVGFFVTCILCKYIVKPSQPRF